jgi:hypothetical protein
MVYRLKITLTGSAPPVWRRVLVPSWIRLQDLHRVIQSVMPWSDIHFHHFAVGRGFIGRPDPDDPDPELLNEAEVPLALVLREPKDAMEYVYDFADEWRHRLVLEAIEPDDPEAARPRCVGGRRACPPEESGSWIGYEAKLAILADPAHPDHAETREWMARETMGGGWDAEHFEVAEANAALAALPPLKPKAAAVKP